MNGNLPLAASDAAVTLERRVGPMRFAFEACRAMTWRGWLWVFGIALVLWAGESAAWIHLHRPAPIPGITFHLIAASCFYLALLIADHFPQNHPRRPSGYVLAVLGAALVSALVNNFLSIMFGTRHFDTAAFADAVTIGMTGIAFWALSGGLAVLVYTRLQSERRARARFAQAELERVTAERQVLASRLAAIQAQVEPRFLFNTLIQIESLYDRDAEAADRMLDDLVAYLRAALPLLRGEASTLGRETGLAESYLRVIRAGAGRWLHVAFDIPTEFRDAAFPPMVLLPLINHAIVCVPERNHAMATIHATTELQRSKLRLTIAASGTDFVPQDADATAIQSIRERLAALYGKDASLELTRVEQHGTRAVIEIPYERAETSDR